MALFVELARAVWEHVTTRLRRPTFLACLVIAVLLSAIGHFAIGDRSLEGLQQANREFRDSLWTLSPFGIYIRAAEMREASKAARLRESVNALRRSPACDWAQAILNPACSAPGPPTGFQQPSVLESIVDLLLTPVRAISAVVAAYADLYAIAREGGALALVMFVATHLLAFLILAAGLGPVAALFLTSVVATLLALAVQLFLLLVTIAFGAVLGLLIWGAGLIGGALWMIQIVRKAEELESAHSLLGALAARLRKRRSSALGA